MKLLEYKSLALRTAAKSDTKYGDLIHAASGLVTEVGEIVDQYKRHTFYKKDYDKVHLTEEVGDVMWYLALALEATDCDLTTTEEEEILPESVEAVKIELILAKLVYNSGTFFSCAFAYPSQMEQESLEGHYPYYLRNTLYFIRMLCLKLDLNYEEAKEKNIAKLKARYPAGFSEDAAVNRDTEAEQKVLAA